jgi:Arm DNA-binding domain
LPDTQQNRRKCDAFLKRIEAEIVLGTFDYAAYFPDGGKVDVFRNLERRVASAKSDTPLFLATSATCMSQPSVSTIPRIQAVSIENLEHRLFRVGKSSTKPNLMQKGSQP